MATVFVLPPLPYAVQALEPVIGRATVALHHGKHQAAYIANLNRLLAAEGAHDASIADVMRRTAGTPRQTALYNNASQAWNHEFYWQSMHPGGGGIPDGRIGEAVHEAFGSYEQFRRQFVNLALTQFGSGWVWLCVADSRLVMEVTSNADNPMSGTGHVPLLVVDVWEHAYYLDYNNRREEYLYALVDNLLNWRFAERNLS